MLQGCLVLFDSWLLQVIVVVVFLEIVWVSLRQGRRCVEGGRSLEHQFYYCYLSISIYLLLLLHERREHSPIEDPLGITISSRSVAITPPSTSYRCRRGCWSLGVSLASTCPEGHSSSCPPCPQSSRWPPSCSGFCSSSSPPLTCSAPPPPSSPCSSSSRATLSE